MLYTTRKNLVCSLYLEDVLEALEGLDTCVV